MLNRVLVRLATLIAYFWFISNAHPPQPPFGATFQTILCTVLFGIPAIVFTRIEENIGDNIVLTGTLALGALIVLVTVSAAAGSLNSVFSVGTICSAAWAGLWIVTRYNIGYAPAPKDER